MNPPAPEYSAERHEIARFVETFVYCALIVFVFLGAYAGSFGDPAYSRLATVYSLTQHGTFYVDAVDGEPNPFERRTIDKVVVDGRTLSSKPPMLTLWMTGVFIMLHTFTGWDLDTPADVDEVLRWMAILIVGSSFLLTLVVFAWTTRIVTPDPLIRTLMLISLAFGTQLWGYSFNINNHVPGVAMMMVSVYIAIGIAAGRFEATAPRLFVFGLCGGLTATIDLPAAIFVFVAGLYLLVRHPRATLIGCSAGVAIPLAIHGWIMLATTGHIIPVQSRPDLYLSQTSYWRHPLGIDALNEPKVNYAFHMFFGRTGLFSLYPILFVGIAGLIHALRTPGAPYRSMIVTGAVAFAVMSLYYLTSTNNYGGESYGFRWFIAAMPVLLLMGSSIFMGIRKRWHRVFVGLMLGVSFFSAWECSKHPWRSNAEWTVRFLDRSYFW